MNRYVQRLKKLRDRLEKDVLLFVNDVSDIRYLTGFTGDSSYLLVSHDIIWFITDGRYIEQIKKEKQIDIELLEITPERKITTIIEKKLRDLDPSIFYVRKDSITIEFYDKIQSVIEELRIPVENSSFINEMRMVKDPVEIELIRQNLQLTELGYAYILREIKEGMTEKEVAAQLEFYLKRQGADAMSFDTIIGSGERSALPHGTASDKKISRGEILLFDFGIIKDGYCSDFTRCYYFDKIIDSKWKKIARIVHEALKTAEGKIKPGIIAKEVHQAAFDVIDDAGYGELFNHSTGHGVGLDIHENPRVSANGDIILKPGMVFTVEPGIYFPGEGGIRLEDLVVVRDRGVEVMTTTSYEI